MSIQSTYLSSIKAYCYGCFHEYGVLPSIAAAQSALESSWGRSSLSKEAKNHHGIKAVSGYPTYSSATKEQDSSGRESTIIAKFAKFPNTGESFNYYGSMLKRNYGITGIKDARKMIEKIAPKYATDVKYVSKVMATINANNLSAWDKDALGGGRGGYTGNFGSVSMGDFADVELPTLEGEQFRTFNNNFISKNTYTRPGNKLEGVTGVILHDAGSAGTSLSSVKNYLSKGGSKTKSGGLHIICDTTNTVAIVPLDEQVYHVSGNHGFSLIKSKANERTISIGLCRESDGTYSEGTIVRAVSVVGELVNKYGIPVETVLREYDLNGKSSPKAYVDNPFDFSVFIGLVSYQKNKSTPLLNEDLRAYYEALNGLAGAGGDFGVYEEYTGDFNSRNNAYNVYNYLLEFARQIIAKNKGLSLTSGYRSGDPNDHGKRLAIDLSGWGSKGGYKNLAKSLSRHPYVSYTIGDNTVYGRKYGDGSKPSWATGHMNHIHISALPPAEAKSSGAAASKESSSGSGEVAGDIEIDKGYILEVKKSLKAYSVSAAKGGTLMATYSKGTILRVLSIEQESYRVAQSTFVRKSDAALYTLKTFGDNVDAPIGKGTVKTSVAVKSVASISGSNFLVSGKGKTIPRGEKVSVYMRQNGMYRISSLDDKAQWVSTSAVDFSTEDLKEYVLNSEENPGGGISAGTGGVSGAGVELIKSFEGYSMKMENIGDGMWTVGWGTAFTPSEARSKGYYLGMIWSKDQALKALEADIASFAKMVKSKMDFKGWTLNQNQFDAVVSYTYNRGPGGLNQLANNSSSISNMGKNITVYWGSATGFKNGLMTRRRKEQDLFFR